MRIRLVLFGFLAWVGATGILRSVGQRLLRPDDWTSTLILFAVSFPLMARLVRRLCLRLRLRQEQWLAGAFSVLLPTFLLDPFSSAFFPLMFPNMAPEVAGVFGGWMLWCCAGGLVGAAIGPRKTA
ncbi:MAG TPA: DUF5367 family protein [Bryobacteraceae bacterium]|nr:DUF5367 family protein [Bryobacteraceae bacterium]